jgi:hypothetical protein
MTGFFEELKRRKVYRVAIAYIVGSWALAQGLSQVLPVFEISNSAIRVLIVLLLIGFPVALVLAWVFDVTPQGIKMTPTVAASGGPRRRNIVMLAVTGFIISAGAGFFKRATELLPESQDAFEGPQITARLAQIYACIGEHDQAIGLVDHLLQTPNGLTVSLLKLVAAPPEVAILTLIKVSSVCSH